MKAKCFFPCLGVSIDKESGVASIYSIIDIIRGVSLPIVMQELNLYANIQREAGEGDVNTLVANGTIGENTIFEVPLEVNFDGKDRTKLKLKLQGFPITTSGILVFSLLDSANKLVASYEVTIQSTEPTIVVSKESE